jgi:WD40 repeat protein
MRLRSLISVLCLLSASWAADGPKLRQSIALPPDVKVNSVAVSPTGKLVAAICSDHQIRLWDVASGVLKATLDLGGERPTVVQFSPGGELLGGGGWDGSLRVWSPSGALQHEYRFPARIDTLAFSPKLETIAVAPSELPLEIRTLADGKLLASFPASFSGSIALAFSPNGHWLASADSDTEIRIIDAVKMSVSARVNDLLVEPLSIAFSSDSSEVVAGTADGVIHQIDTNTGKIRKAFPKQTGVVYALCTSPDGKAVTGAYFNPDLISAPANIMTWDPSSATLRAAVPSQDSGFTGGTYLADSTLLLTSGVSTELKVWSYR